MLPQKSGLSGTHLYIMMDIEGKILNGSFPL